MIEQRPDPDALLAKLNLAEARSRRGRLKIFFGAAAGVGKTYAMLSEGREKRAEGTDVVIGVVETHGRVETLALAEGLGALPPRIIDYRGTQLREFDLDAALKRCPTLILVDELAHTNAEGSRHPKRWNDVEELLDAGIDVYTTLNVQHLESLNDIVGGITQVRVWETVPDTVFEHADEVEIVDLPPDDLLERLREGKVYLPQQAERAIENFFRKGNLIALRELALRRTAERVDAQMRDYRDDKAIRDIWRAGERILVCIGPNPIAERLIRAGKRLASSLHADWIVAYVESPRLQRLNAAARDELLAYLRLAEELGAETATLSAQDMSATILEFAHRKNATKIVLGKPTRTGWRRWLLGSIVDTIVRGAHDLDIYLLATDKEAIALQPGNLALLTRSRAYLGLAEQEKGSAKTRYPRYLWGIGVTALTTAISALMFGHFDLSNLVMVYLLGVVVVAARFGRGPSVLSSVLSVAAFDFFFVSPRFSFAVSDVQYLITFAVMLLVGLIVGTLTVNLRSEAKVSAHRERRAGVLYAFTRALGSAQTEEEIARAAVKHIGDEFEGQSVILFPDAEGRIRYPESQSMQYSFHSADLGVAQWVFDHAKPAGKGTDTLPGTEGVYFPIKGSSGVIGVLALLPVNLRRIFLPEQQRLVDTFISQLVQAIERVRLAKEAQTARVNAETESLRNSLLAAISHDFRTPLASIVGASSSLIDRGTTLSEDARRDLSKTIYEEARRMTRLANNLLDMARLEAGGVKLKREWYPIEEIVGGVLTRLQTRLENHPVKVNLPPGLPLVQVDAVMIEQVLENLLENALKYTPGGTAIEVGAEANSREVAFWVADRGPGLPPGKEDLLFEKFFRATAEGAQSGVGLGLTICRAIVTAHGGTIDAENREGGGALFRFTIPVTEAPPQIVPEEEQLLAVK
ncbi:MAG TPA: sensor histidine kinase KdpD [Burkholderiales bacterium]|nr:sensor histidine kinase KdpD [Burkholderiales bacterium]